MMVVDFDNPIAIPSGAGFEGVARIDFVKVSGSTDTCTGALLPTGRHILTAAHCVISGNGGPLYPVDLDLALTSVKFFVSPGVEPVYQIASVTRNPDYLTGHGLRELGADIAILELTTEVDQRIPRYDIYRASDEIGQVFTRVGFGRSGTGASGVQANTLGVKRSGMNRFDSDAVELNAFGGDLDEPLAADYVEGVYLVSDFDGGTNQSDSLGILNIESDLGLLNETSGDPGSESTSAGSDSGGPLFLGGKIAGVTSHGRFLISLLPSPPIFGRIAFDTRVSHYASWIDSVIDFDIGPRVSGVTVSGSQSMHDPYPLPSGSGEQIRTIPVGGADTFTITFNENVTVPSNALQLVGLRSGNRPTLAQFTHTPGTGTASWRFDGFSTYDQYVLTLADSVTNAAGVPLDGEWTNPAALAAPQKNLLSSFTVRN